MNQEKLKQYELTGSFHTFTVKTQGLIDAKAKEKTGISNCTINPEQTGTTTTINLNKIQGDIFNYKKFEEIFEDLRKKVGMKNYRLLRADFRLDSYNKEHYRAFEKLNKYLISAIAVTYNVKNCYKTDGLFSHKQLSIAIKNEDFQLENYDRQAKSNNTENHNEPAKARLEERSMASQFYGASGDGLELLREEFTTHWFERWDKAIENLDAVAERYNNELEKIYREEKDAFPVRFRSITEFVMQYQDSIFTQKQLINLLERLGFSNAKERAKNYKKRYGIEYFSRKDVKTAIEEVKRATLEYFNVDEKEGMDDPFLSLEDLPEDTEIPWEFLQ